MVDSIIFSGDAGFLSGTFFRLQVLMSSLLLFISQVNFPLCTIAHTPRMPEHCVEYAKVLVWPQEHPFGGMTLSL